MYCTYCKDGEEIIRASVDDEPGIQVGTNHFALIDIRAQSRGFLDQALRVKPSSACTGHPSVPFNFHDE